jgi:hypothetical protein
MPEPMTREKPTAMINFDAPFKPSFLSRNRNPCEHLESKPIRRGPIREPALRLWKLCAQAVSLRFMLIESIILLIALVMTISCFAELTYLLGNDAVCNAIERLIAGR